VHCGFRKQLCRKAMNSALVRAIGSTKAMLVPPIRMQGISIMSAHHSASASFGMRFRLDVAMRSSRRSHSRAGPHRWTAPHGVPLHCRRRQSIPAHAARTASAIAVGPASICSPSALTRPATRESPATSAAAPADWMTGIRASQRRWKLFSSSSVLRDDHRGHVSAPQRIGHNPGQFGGIGNVGRHQNEAAAVGGVGHGYSCLGRRLKPIWPNCSKRDRPARQKDQLPR
jgi:hypothetical protein